MKKEQGFTLIELLIVVAIIAIIAAIAVPNLLNARMAANETSAVASLRSIASAQIAFSAVNGGIYGNLQALKDSGQLDSRFGTGGLISGYWLDESNDFPEDLEVESGLAQPIFVTGVSSYVAEPVNPGTTGRYEYIMGTDFVVRYQGTSACPAGMGNDCQGQPVGGKSAKAGS